MKKSQDKSGKYGSCSKASICCTLLKAPYVKAHHHGSKCACQAIDSIFLDKCTAINIPNLGGKMLS